jgi:hypothetical protein
MGEGRNYSRTRGRKINDLPSQGMQGTVVTVFLQGTEGKLIITLLRDMDSRVRSQF